MESTRRPLTTDLDIVAIDADHIKATAGNMLFMVWRIRTTEAAYQQGADVVRRLAVEHPTGVGVANVVEVGAVPPDAEARRAFVNFLRLPAVQHFSVTHEGTGFKAASVRAIVSSAQSFARPAFSHAVHKSVMEAASWHAERQRKLGHFETPDEIAGIIYKLRNIHNSHHPDALANMGAR